MRRLPGMALVRRAVTILALVGLTGGGAFKVSLGQVPPSPPVSPPPGYPAGMAPGAPAPAVQDTALAVLEFPDPDLTPSGAHTVQDTVPFGGVFFVVLDYDELSATSTQLALDMCEGDYAWLELLVRADKEREEYETYILPASLKHITEEEIGMLRLEDGKPMQYLPVHTGKSLIVSDAAINIAPDLDTKLDITQNAIDLAHALGIRTRRRHAVLRALHLARSDHLHGLGDLLSTFNTRDLRAYLFFTSHG